MSKLFHFNHFKRAETWQHTPSYTIFSHLPSHYRSVSVSMKCVCAFFINIKISASIGSATTILNWERIDFFSACKHTHNTFNCRAFCNAINNYSLKPINWSFSVEWVSKLRKEWRIRQCIWSGQFHQIAHFKKERKKESRSGRLFCYMLMKCSSDVSL